MSRGNLKSEKQFEIYSTNDLHDYHSYVMHGVEQILETNLVAKYDLSE